MTLFWPDGPGDSLAIRGARVIDPARGLDGAFDVTIEDGVITARRARRRVGPRPRARSRLRRPARPPPRARPRGRGDDRLRHGGGRRRRLLRDPRDAEHRSRRRLGRRARGADRAGARGGGDPDRLHGVDLEGPPRRGADRDGRARPARGGGVHGRRAPGRLGRPDAARAAVQRRHGADARAPRGGADALARRPDARGRRLGGARPRRLAVGGGVGDDRARLRPCCIRATPFAYNASLGPGVRGRGTGRAGSAASPSARRSRPTISA